MKFGRTLKLFTLLAVIATGAASAQGHPPTQGYHVHPADSTHSPHGGDHALWMPGSGNIPNGGNSKFVNYADNPLMLTVTTGAGPATATLMGTVQSVGDATSIWDVQFHFTETDLRTPKLELYSSNYTTNGGTIDPTTWTLFDLNSATLTGNADGADAGTVLTVTHRGLPNYGFQLGTGANGKNLEYGFSGWFNYSGAYSGYGDVNVDLKPKGNPVPEPASLALLSLGAFMVNRRR